MGWGRTLTRGMNVRAANTSGWSAPKWRCFVYHYPSLRAMLLPPSSGTESWDRKEPGAMFRPGGMGTHPIPPFDSGTENTPLDGGDVFCQWRLQPPPTELIHPGGEGTADRVWQMSTCLSKLSHDVLSPQWRTCSQSLRGFIAVRKDGSLTYVCVYGVTLTTLSVVTLFLNYNIDEFCDTVVHTWLLISGFSVQMIAPSTNKERISHQYQGLFISLWFPSIMSLIWRL